MPCKIHNEYGTITIENDVIARIAGLAAVDCYGIVGMAAKSVKDGLVHLLKKESIAKGTKLSITDDSFSVDLHIIVEYGTNIVAIAETIISNVKFRIEEAIGIKVGMVNVYIEGIRVD